LLLEVLTSNIFKAVFQVFSQRDNAVSFDKLKAQFQQFLATKVNHNWQQVIWTLVCYASAPIGQRH